MWAGIGLATIFTIIRTIIRLHISRRIFMDDVFVYIALAVLIAMGVLYTLIMDELFEIVLVSEGRLPPTASFAAGIPFFLKSQFAIIVLFWTTLWAVKFSFLLYYKKLFVGLPGHMQKCWWAVVIFSLLAYLGCWATQIAACVPISSYFTGQCNTPRDIYVGNLSLYYAMAVDIICDILSKHNLQVLRLIYRSSFLASHGTATSASVGPADQYSTKVCSGWNIPPWHYYYCIRNSSSSRDQRNIRSCKSDVVGSLVYG